MTTDPRYPIGKMQFVDYSEKEKEARLADILFLPRMLEYAVLNLDETQIQTPYRDGGWTVNQLIHHVADSHMNAFIRFKLALTEDNPTIKPYSEAVWAELTDYKLPPFVSLELLKGVHLKWTALLNSMTAIDFSKTYFHPEHQESFELKNAVGVYAWHCNHHFAHIEQALAAGGNY